MNKDSTEKGNVKGRKWTLEAMTLAYNAVKSGHLSISAASKKYGVPRTSLSDRVKGRVRVNAKWGNPTALSKDEESCLAHYIEFMAKRGFPLTIRQIVGFAWCIAKEHGKADIFKKNGPSKRWWRGFKRRNPQLRLRRPDSLDRGRASMGNVHSLTEYFEILKETLDANNLHEKPHLIFNCDEAAINLNKTAGQRVVVPSSQKHSHSMAAATNEHITVHCCVNAAGGTVPPMIIFTKSFPGGSYHKKGPINASYATSDTGFMDGALYFQWFEKTFLPFAPSERPLLLIQDGASSHISCQLVKSAISNDVILLCLPPKTTHITQPLDVAVYRKMKIEAADIMSKAKLIKSDLWVSKKNVTAMFKIIYENSFTMRCITEGFRKCGIHPYNPNAVDKSLLLRSCDIVNEEDIDLSLCTKNVVTSDTADFSIDTLPREPLASSSPKQIAQQDTNASATSAANYLDFDGFENITFVVGEDGILSLDTDPEKQTNNIDIPDTTESNAASVCPPELALAAVECALTPRKKRKFHECLNFDIDLPEDSVYQTWKTLKRKVENNVRYQENDSVESITPEYTATKVPTCLTSEKDSKIAEMKPGTLEKDTDNKPTKTHPLVKAGLIPEDLAEILVTPSFDTKQRSAAGKGKKKARVLTSAEVELELLEKEKLKQEKEKMIKTKKAERERKKIERAMAVEKKKEEMLKKKQLREQTKAAKEEIKRQKQAAKKSKSNVEKNDVCDELNKSESNEK